jgi:hypothetical protein
MMTRAAAALSQRQRRRRGGNGLGLGADIATANKLIGKWGLAPDLGMVDASRSPEINNLIGNAQDLYGRFTQRDPAQAQLLAQLQAGQSGLTAQEQQSLREQAESGLDSSLQTALRGLAANSAASGLMGGVAQAGQLDLLTQRLAQQRGVERDIMNQNIAVKDARQQRLAGYLNDLVAGEANRGRGALADLTGLTTGARADDLARQQFNLAQQQAAIANKNALILGLAGASGNRRAQRKQFQLFQQQIGANRDIANRAFNSIGSAAAPSADSGTGI